MASRKSGELTLKITKTLSYESSDFVEDQNIDF